MKKRPRAWQWIAGFAALAALAAAAAFLLPLRDGSGVLEDHIERMELVEGLAAFCAIYVVASLLLVPAWISAGASSRQRCPRSWGRWPRF
jgi:hypothetical protein